MATKTVKREITRSRTGCWTCRTRRKKCDEARPVCRTCTGLDLVCEGYGVRLKWAVHRKSRVTFSSQASRSSSVRATQSPRDSSGLSPESAGNSPEDMNARDELLLQHLGQPAFSTLSKLERSALYDFADWGAATLGSTNAIGPDYFAENLDGCSESRPMLLNCITYQITLDPKYAQWADQYYCRSLEEYRHALSISTSLDNDNTCCAGLLLCSISMNRAMPWTIHLNGLTSVLREKGKFESSRHGQHETVSLIGVLDLPTHILGRQNKHLHVWYNYCQNKPGIEEITGLPRTLIDILSSIMHTGVEERLLQWAPHASEVSDASDDVLCKVWDTVRYAAMVAARDFAPSYVSPTLLCESAVHYVLLHLRELEPVIKDRMVAARRALLFPLAAAGSVPALLTAQDKSFIAASISDLSDGDGDLYHHQVILTLGEYWEHWASGGRTSLQQFVKNQGRELGLF